MAVVVFDSDVLIGFMSASDAHHQDAVARVRRALQEPGIRLWLCAVNLSEILIGPLRAGVPDKVEAMLVRFGIETIAVDKALAERAAAVGGGPPLQLAEAYALATAIHAERRGFTDVELATFDEAVRRAHAALRPSSPQQ
jgi:predicted nucleic acid-binding protein